MVPNGRRRAHTLESSSPSANHVKSNFVNQQQASSDSELHRGRSARHLDDSLTNLGEAGGRRPQDGGVTARGIILPNVANMKQNVSEKVAQIFRFFIENVGALAYRKGSWLPSKRSEIRIPVWANSIFHGSSVSTHQ
ncbi:hypothetical protein PoB_001853900 [Plakobranchus ocellatus]|uniref:Uncharacterized protein n=1 Tax=Plakobranchus ocellatus TaxID=259542 RepID=A0AAV3ZDR9_9GAST|nr:hypothetical protein PoB_001853900 [Plakobranchus ocellatus]